MTNIVRYIYASIYLPSPMEKKSLTLPIVYCSFNQFHRFSFFFPLNSEEVPFQGGKRNLNNYIPSFCAHLFGCTYTCLMRDSFIHMKEAHHMFL